MKIDKHFLVSINKISTFNKNLTSECSIMYYLYYIICHVILHYNTIYTIFTIYNHVMPAVSGWGGEVFTGYTHWWIVPVLACHAGALLGASLYWLLLTTEVTEVTESSEDDVVKDIRKDKISIK